MGPRRFRRFRRRKRTNAILSTTEPYGAPFRMLGLLVDSQLHMGCAIRECAHEASWKLRTLLRTRRVHTTSDLFLLFKSHILSYLEYRTPAIYHAAATVLDPIDRILRSFLRDLCVPEIDALLSFNLAPLAARRDIAMLGLIHRTVLGEGPPHFSQWFRIESEQQLRRSERQARNTVDPLKSLPVGRSLGLIKRNAFGLIPVYNLLPNDIVRRDSVQEFQRVLTNLMKDVASSNNPNWPVLFSPRCLAALHPLRRV